MAYFNRAELTEFQLTLNQGHETSYCGMLLSGLLGNETAAKVLLMLENDREVYARRIASHFGVAVSQVQRQLQRLEREKILISHMMGKTKIYNFNSKYPLLNPLRSLLGNALTQLPQETRLRYFRDRQRLNKYPKIYYTSSEEE